MLGRLLHFILRLICEWRGHDEQDAPTFRPIDLRPGRILEVPTPKLFEIYQPPVLPAELVDRMPLEMRTKYLLQLANPPIRIHRFYCARCGEAWS